MAAEEVKVYLQSRPEWRNELQKGKMLGVLIVRTPEQRIGYLAAFSGNLAGSNHHSFFVPPVYDMLQPDGFFRLEEATISAINQHIKEMEQASAYRQAQEELQKVKQDAENVITQAKQALRKEAKKKKKR